MRRPHRILGLLLVLAFAASGCAGLFGGTQEVNAVFSDVSDLTTDNAVRISDVQVGRVSDVTLDDEMRAVVEMEVREDIDLPADLMARLRKTSVLGERYVELVPTGEGGSWSDGDLITQTEVVPELEEVIATSTDLLVAVSTDTLAGAIRSGALGLEGRGQSLGSIVDDLELVTRTYNANSDDLVRLLDGLDGFLDSVGPQAAVHGRALEEAATFVRVLAEEDDRLVDSLTQLRDLAETGEDIIVTHRARIDDFTRYLEGITDELVRPDVIDDIDTLFINAAQHNFATIRGVNAENAQIVLDLVICGVNEEGGNPVRQCQDPPQGQPAPTPRPPQDF